jgi:alpha-methylacyl-CoA racemase
VYEAADGGYVTLAALEPQFWGAFCRAIGRGDLVDQQFAPAVPGEPIYDELRALFRARTREEWVVALDGIDACCEPVYDVREALASAPLRGLGMLAEGGLLPPVRLSARAAHPPDPAPTLGQHTADLLAELGYDREAVATLRESGVI